MAHGLDQETYKQQVSGVWKATAWLTFITIIEVVAAFVYPESAPRWLLNLFFVLASLLKAYFIVGEFMHVRYEKRALALTILVPTIFLIWFLIAFIWEGTAWLEMRKMWGM